MNIIKADIIKAAKSGNYGVLIHGCNCFCTMGAGVAKLIKENFREAWLADANTISGDINKLGKFSCEVIRGYDILIFNAYTQYRYGRNKKHFSEDALISCLRNIKRCTDKNDKIIMPKIGCGLGGGDWEIVRGIIENEMAGYNITICTID